MKKTIQILIILLLVLGLKINLAQSPIKFRVDKQAISTPMTPTYDIFFGSSYYTRPININFDGKILNINYDNGSIFKKMNLKLVDKIEFSYNNIIEYERFLYIDPKIPLDTIIYEVGYFVGYVRIIIPTKSESGEYYGYISYIYYDKKYKKYKNNTKLALNSN